MDSVSISMPVDAPGERTTSARIRSLRLLEWIVATYAVLLIGASIVIFMVADTSNKVGDLIAMQNDAALRLWMNIDYFAHHRNEDQPTDASLPPGLFASLVEFSRANASIMKNVHRLSLETLFAPTASLDDIVSRLTPKDGNAPPPGKQAYFDHTGVDPRTDARNIVDQGMYQIELYQAIRDYAQDKSAFYKDCLGAVSAYVTPVLYALLGAFLWAFRSSCRRAGEAGSDPLPDRSSRFVMAAIAGITISVLGTWLPKDMLLSPLAIAFVFGYSIEVFTSRLDAYIDSLSATPSGQGDRAPAG